MIFKIPVNSLLVMRCSTVDIIYNVKKTVSRGKNRTYFEKKMRNTNTYCPFTFYSEYHCIGRALWQMIFQQQHEGALQLEKLPEIKGA